MLEIVDDIKALELPWKGIFISVGIFLFLELVVFATLLVTL